jgi:hypothetical protein
MWSAGLECQPSELRSLASIGVRLYTLSHKSDGWGHRDWKESLMRYKAKSIAALQLALGSLPDKMRVEVEPAIEVSAMVACSGSERTHVRFL